MELPNRETGISPILGFCKAVVSRHFENWPPKEETLAEEFVPWFGLQPFFLTRDRLIELCLSKGVHLSFAALPQELRGCNCSFQDKTVIVLTQRETVLGADMHTLLHEFREPLEHAFVELGYGTLGAEEFPEVRAERFAVAARLEMAKKEIPAFIESAMKVDARWARYLAYISIGVFRLIYALSCVSLPHLEEIDSEVERQRYVRT